MASLARLDHLIGAVHRAQANHRTAEYRRQLAALATEAVLLARTLPSDERTTAGLLGGPRRRPANRPDPDAGSSTSAT